MILNEEATIKSHDRYEIQFQCFDDNNEPADLTGATVRLLSRPRYPGGSETMELSIKEIEYNIGIITHMLDGSMDDPNTYEIEVEATRADTGEITTYPNKQKSGKKYVLLKVNPDLG